jgi:hypothetical protein
MKKYTITEEELRIILEKTYQLGLSGYEDCQEDIVSSLIEECSGMEANEKLEDYWNKIKPSNNWTITTTF